MTRANRKPHAIRKAPAATAQTIRMKDKNGIFQKVQALKQSAHHHSVYVALLDPCILRFVSVQRANPKRDPEKPCVYVGMSGLPPEERFQNHKNGIKAAGWVKNFGVKLLPELYEYFNPMPFEAAVVMEKELAEDLREQGYTVLGGH